DLWATLVEVGFTLVGFEERDLAEVAALARIAARHAAPVPLAETLLAAQMLAAAGVDPDGEALTFARAGAKLQVDGATLDGVVERVPWVRVASKLVVLSDAANTVLVVDPSACRLEEHANLAGEPRDDVHAAGVD